MRTLCLALLSAAVLLCGTAAFSIEGVPEGYKLASVSLTDCYWQCDDNGAHWLKFLECRVDEVAVGSCGVSGSNDCKDPLIGREVCPNGEKGYSGLRCCKMDLVVEKIE